MIQQFLVQAYTQRTESRVWKTHLHTVFTAALFTAAKRREQLKCPSTDEWISKMWRWHTTEYYSASRKEGSFDTCSTTDAP